MGLKDSRLKFATVVETLEVIASVPALEGEQRDISSCA